MTSEQIRTVLRDNGFEEKSIKYMSKDQLVQAHDGLVNSKNLLDNVTVDKATDLVPSNQNPNTGAERPNPSDPRWTDYVMEQFDEDELDKNSRMPRVDGLRRVAYQLLGNFDVRVEIPQVPQPANGNRATSIVTLDFRESKRVVSDAADVYQGNTGSKFAVHAVAVATTRAEGRALRKALYLVKVLAAEELYGADKTNDQSDDVRETPISNTMINGLTLLCGKQNIDLYKLAIIYYDIGSIEELTHKEGLAISDILSKFQRKELEIPTEVKI